MENIKGHRPPPTMENTNKPMSPVEVFMEHGYIQSFIGFWKNNSDNLKVGWIYNEDEAKRMINILPCYCPEKFKIVKFD